MKDLDAMDSMEKMLIQKAYQRQAPINGSSGIITTLQYELRYVLCSFI